MNYAVSYVPDETVRERSHSPVLGLVFGAATGPPVSSRAVWAPAAPRHASRRISQRRGVPPPTQWQPPAAMAPPAGGYLLAFGSGNEKLHILGRQTGYKQIS